MEISYRVTDLYRVPKCLTQREAPEPPHTCRERPWRSGDADRSRVGVRPVTGLRRTMDDFGTDRKSVV